MSSPNPQRGEVWLINFDPAEGAEIQKIRPAVVLNVQQVGRLPLKIIVPITTGNANFNKFFWMVAISANSANGLSHDSFADTFQIKSVSINRFKNKLGILTDAQINEITAAVVLSIGYTPPKKD